MGWPAAKRESRNEANRRGECGTAPNKPRHLIRQFKRVPKPPSHRRSVKIVGQWPRRRQLVGVTRPISRCQTTARWIVPHKVRQKVRHEVRTRRIDLRSLHSRISCPNSGCLMRRDMRAKEQPKLTSSRPASEDVQVKPANRMTPAAQRRIHQLLAGWALRALFASRRENEDAELTADQRGSDGHQKRS